MNGHDVLSVSCENNQEKIVRLLEGNGEITTDQIKEDFKDEYHQTIVGTALNVALGILANHERIQMRYDSAEGRVVKLV